MNKPVLATLEQCFGSDYHKLRVYTDLYEEGSQSYFVLKEIGSYMGCKSYHRLLKKLPASAVQKRLIKNSGGRMHRMLLVSEEGVLALLKHCGHKAATGFKQYLETCVIPVIRREIDTAGSFCLKAKKHTRIRRKKRIWRRPSGCSQALWPSRSLKIRSLKRGSK